VIAVVNATRMPAATGLLTSLGTNSECLRDVCVYVYDVMCVLEALLFNIYYPVFKRGVGNTALIGEPYLIAARVFDNQSKTQAYCISHFRLLRS
jgi:hypothetical protein